MEGQGKGVLMILCTEFEAMTALIVTMFSIALLFAWIITKKEQNDE
jgi:hypothetical protein